VLKENAQSLQIVNLREMTLNVRRKRKKKRRIRARKRIKTRRKIKKNRNREIKIKINKSMEKLKINRVKVRNKKAKRKRSKQAEIKKMFLQPKSNPLFQNSRSQQATKFLSTNCYSSSYYNSETARLSI